MNIEELTEKIYQEGVEKAQQQEQTLLEQARKEADTILAEARRKAADEIELARKEAEKTKAVLGTELKLAGEMSLEQLRRSITDCLVDFVLPESVSTALRDPHFMEKLILEVAQHWDARQTSMDISIVLSPELQELLSDQFMARAKELLDRGLEVRVSEEIKGGFRIEPKDGSYRVSVDEESFAAFFRSFLRDRTRKILFPTPSEPSDHPSASAAGQQS
jgi:V/A-type H+-transporting ATPase subunit E